MKKLLIVPLVIIFVVIIWLFYPTEERRMKNDINDLKNVVEHKSIAIVSAYLDIQYGDNNDLTRDQLIDALGRFFAEVDSINVQMRGLKVWVDSTTADNTIFGRCSLGLRVLARYEGERVLAFGGIVKPRTVQARLIKTDDMYKVYYAEY
ncbi:MAG: hypothetical protein JSV98_05110 [candidate division WOR-3 bacterium]|nr:MAG: hypothetical protein JSV98_05110 [candidate division WOR-3 bacterium]